MKTLPLFAAALALLLSACSSNEEEERGKQPSSSSSIGYTGSYGSVTDDNGKTYRTVEIGTQTWMAENLAFDRDGSKVCYDNSNLSKYGRLYNWATAMALPSNCNTNTCTVQPKHRGICPSGWHIPSDDDWSVLVNYAGGSNTAGRKLKATSS